MLKSLISVGLAAALALSGCARAPERPADLAVGDYRYLRDYLSWYIPEQMAKHDVPGVSIALVDGDRVVWATGFGYADRERRVPADADTVYQAGSISKVLTATAAMQLVEQGRLRLDAPLTDYLPDFSMQSRWPSPPPLTPRALLAHHAGLPTYYLKGFFSNQPVAALVDQLRVEHLAYPPGQVFNYSNLGPNLVGLAIERVSGRPFVEHVQTALLEPLGMRHSAFALNDRLAARLARGYVDDRAVDPVTIRDVPSGALLSSVNDLARFMRFVLNDGRLDGRQIVAPATLAEMRRPQYADAPLDFGQRFGLGWMLSGIDIPGGGPVVWHNGGTKAFLSQMIVLPERRLGVVVLANAESAGPLVYDVAEQTLRLALEARDGLQPPPPAPEPVFIELDPEVLDRYVGDYSLMGTLARIDRDGRRLRLHVLDHTLDLAAVSETEFRARYRLLGLVPVTIPFPPVEFTRVAGRQFAVLRDRGVVSVAEKVPDYEVPDAWRQRTGDYKIVNPDDQYLVQLDRCRMLVENDRLLLDIRISGLDDRQVKIVVVPLSDTEAYVFGLGRNVGDVTRVVNDGGGVRMWYSGYLFERETRDAPAPVVAGLAAPAGPAVTSDSSVRR
ncbi:MAG TPA: serine hydrolase domain-containing protein [Acidiferrobacterales bacterium]